MVKSFNDEFQQNFFNQKYLYNAWNGISIEVVENISQNIVDYMNNIFGYMNIRITIY